MNKHKRTWYFMLLSILILFVLTCTCTRDCHGNLASASETGSNQDLLEQDLLEQDLLEQEIIVVMVGDVLMANWLEPLLLKNPAYPYADPEIRKILAQGDLVLGNLEAPFSQRGEIYVEKQFTFRCHPETVATLTAGGFDFVSLANNHIMDYGPEALEDTIAVLNKHGISHAGAGRNLKEARRPAVLEQNGLRVAVLAYNNTFPLEFNAVAGRPGTARGVWEDIRDDVKKAAGLADLVIVSFHWSGERVKTPRDYQRSFGRLCIDAGAHVVFGHHPHVHQGVEVYKNGLIAYSLGNFIFATYSKNSRDSLILKVRMDRSGLQAAEIYPININNNEVAFQPRLFRGEEAGRLLGEVKELSAAFDTSVEIKGDIGVITLPRHDRPEPVTPDQEISEQEESEQEVPEEKAMK